MIRRIVIWYKWRRMQRAANLLKKEADKFNKKLLEYHEN